MDFVFAWQIIETSSKLVSLPRKLKRSNDAIWTVMSRICELWTHWQKYAPLMSFGSQNNRSCYCCALQLHKLQRPTANGQYFLIKCNSGWAAALWASLFIQRGKWAATVTRIWIWNRSCTTGRGNRRDTKFRGGTRQAGNKKFVFILHKNVFSQESVGEML